MSSPDPTPGAAPENAGGFGATQWSVVLAAGRGDSPEAQAALARLCQAYWYPLYLYVRRQGHSAEDAEDLTQAFFAHFLEKRTFRLADQGRGRFRSFLLTSLKHFLVNEWERAQTQKRGGQCPTISLNDDSAEDRYQLEPAAPDLTPDKLFDRRWAITVLEQALERLRQEQASAGKDRQFELLKPFLSQDAPEGGYEQVAAALGLTANAATVAVHRLRHRYRDEIRNQIAETVTTAVELAEEMRHLFAALSG